MSTFINNIKNHKKLAAICGAVLVAAIAVAVLVCVQANRHEGTTQSNTEKPKVYFEDTDYPVTVRKKDGILEFELDGSKSADLKWNYSVEPTVVAQLEEKSFEKKGKQKLFLTPLAAGYANATFTRSTELAGVHYDVVSIYADFFVSVDQNGEKQLTLNNMRQVGATAGAIDTEQPYLLDKNRILLPKGGDWEVTAEPPAGVPENQFFIYRDTDETGMEFISVAYDRSVVNERAEGEAEDYEAASAYDTVFVLKSASLGQEHRLMFMRNDVQEWALSAAEATDGN